MFTLTLRLKLTLMPAPFQIKSEAVLYLIQTPLPRDKLLAFTALLFIVRLRFKYVDLLDSGILVAL